MKYREQNSSLRAFKVGKAINTSLSMLEANEKDYRPCHKISRLGNASAFGFCHHGKILDWFSGGIW